MPDLKVQRTTCLWCGSEFDWDDSMYRFCQNCTDKVAVVEELTGYRPLIDKLERRLKLKR